jgi:hypothetical protein
MSLLALNFAPVLALDDVKQVGTSCSEVLHAHFASALALTSTLSGKILIFLCCDDMTRCHEAVSHACF